jgi:regulator of protease activity HflC (stomatin/prohibitin superfamily)
MIRQAEAQGIKMINEANPSSAVLTIRSYEALAKVADGKATKMIIPSDLQNLSTMAATVTQIVENTKDNK